MLLVFLVIAPSSLQRTSVQFRMGGSVSRAIFFKDFFTFLILADILILLVSYWFYTDFGNLARNTGFVLYGYHTSPYLPTGFHDDTFHTGYLRRNTEDV